MGMQAEQDGRRSARAGRFPQLFLGLVVLAGGLTVGAGALRDGLRARSGQQAITVTGSARKTIVSDTVVWRAALASTQAAPAGASKELAAPGGRGRALLPGGGAARGGGRPEPA